MNVQYRLLTHAHIFNDLLKVSILSHNRPRMFHNSTVLTRADSYLEKFYKVLPPYIHRHNNWTNLRSSRTTESQAGNQKVTAAELPHASCFVQKYIKLSEGDF